MAQAIKQYGLKLMGVILLVFAPMKSVLITVIVLTAIDLLSGVIAAKKRGELITSAGLKRTIIKLFVYELVVLLSYLTEQYLTGDLVPLVKILAGFIGITELKSVLENLEDITGIPILKMLIDKLTSLNNP